MIVENIIPRNMIINLGCASVDNRIPRDDIFDYHPLRECNIYILSIKHPLHMYASGLCTPVKYFLLTIPRWYFFCGLFMLFLSCVCYIVCFRAHLFIVALWSPAGRGLTSWLSFVMSNCGYVTFPSVSWVRCGT